MSNECYFVVPAAGSGTRMGGTTPKLLLEVCGLSVIGRTLDVLTEFCSSMDKSGIVLSTTPDLIDVLKDLCGKRYGDFPFVFTLGGKSRTESVGNGVKALEKLLPGDDAVVMVHDGARCLVTADEIRAVYDGVRSSGICACAVPVKSTLKEVSVGSDGTINVVRTPERSSLYEILTPQGFTYERITACYDYALANDVVATDDTALAELLGLKVTLAEGRYSNIKITTVEDIAIASEIIKARQQK